jgi:hypothetical protein
MTGATERRAATCSCTDGSKLPAPRTLRQVDVPGVAGVANGQLVHAGLYDPPLVAQRAPLARSELFTIAGLTNWVSGFRKVGNDADRIALRALLTWLEESPIAGVTDAPPVLAACDRPAPMTILARCNVYLATIACTAVRPVSTNPSVDRLANAARRALVLRRKVPHVAVVTHDAVDLVVPEHRSLRLLAKAAKVGHKRLRQTYGSYGH